MGTQKHIMFADNQISITETWPVKFNICNTTCKQPVVITYKFQHVPVKDIIVGEALSVKQISEELP